MATLKVDKTLAAFLDLIAWSEGTSTHPLTKNDGYDVIVSGVDGRHVFTDFSTHPFALGRKPILVREAEYKGLKGPTTDYTAAVLPVTEVSSVLQSTASGRYQIELETWKEIAATVHLGTFSEANQDEAGLTLIERRHATNAILAGYISEAMSLCCLEWASFPGNLYHQGGHTAEELLSNYDRLLKAQSE